MNKIILVLWIVLLPMTSLRAQDRDSIFVYKQLNDWAVVKLTIAYMEDLREFTPEKKGNNGTDKEYSTYEFLSKHYQDYPTEKKIDLDSIGELLINGAWQRTKEQVFDKYKTFFSNPTNSIPHVNQYGYNTDLTQASFKKTKIALSEQYAELTRAKKLSVDSLSLNKLVVNGTVQVDNKFRHNKNSSERTSGLPFWFYVILGVLIISIVLLVESNRNLKLSLKKKRKNRPEKQSSSNRDINIELNENIQCLKNQNKDLKEENENLKATLENSKNAVGRETNESPNSELPSQVIDLEFHQPKVNNLIYLPSPFRNLTFANENASAVKTKNSLYQVEFNEQMQTGELSVIADADLSRALNSPDSYLETACAYDNEYFNNARTIQVTEKGEIKLDGEDWTVTKKVRIKFI